MAESLGPLDVDNVAARIARLLAEFPNSDITLQVSLCVCKCCQANPDQSDVTICMSGTREDGRLLEPTFCEIKVFHFDWIPERWEARLDVLRMWLKNKVTRDLPNELIHRLGPGLAGHIMLVETVAHQV